MLSAFRGFRLSGTDRSGTPVHLCSHPGTLISESNGPKTKPMGRQLTRWPDTCRSSFNALWFPKEFIRELWRLVGSYRTWIATAIPLCVHLFEACRTFGLRGLWLPLLFCLLFFGASLAKSSKRSDGATDGRRGWKVRAAWFVFIPEIYKAKKIQRSIATLQDAGRWSLFDCMQIALHEIYGGLFTCSMS